MQLLYYTCIYSAQNVHKCNCNCKKYVQDATEFYFFCGPAPFFDAACGLADEVAREPGRLDSIGLSGIHGCSGSLTP